MTALEPFECLQRLLERHRHIAQRRNLELEQYAFYRSPRLFQLKKDWSKLSTKEQQDAIALEQLCEGGYEHWITNSRKAYNYELAEVGDGTTHVWRKGSDRSTGRPRVLSATSRCDCEERVAFLVQCCHEICFDGLQFKIEKWSERFRYRTGIEVSAGALANGDLGNNVLDHEGGLGVDTGYSDAGGDRRSLDNGDNQDSNVNSNDSYWHGSNYDRHDNDYDWAELEKENSPTRHNSGRSSRRKIPHAMRKELFSELEEVVSKQDDEVFLTGYLVKFLDFIKKRKSPNPSPPPDPYSFRPENAEAWRDFSSCFLSSQLGACMFAPSQVSTSQVEIDSHEMDSHEMDSHEHEMDSHEMDSNGQPEQIFHVDGVSQVQPLLPRANFQNRPRKRLKSGPELFAQKLRRGLPASLTSSAKHMMKKCSFCHDASHTRASCAKLKHLVSGSNDVLQPGGKHAEEFLQFSENLGDRSYFVMEEPSLELQQMPPEALELNKVLPTHARHFVLEKLFRCPWASAFPSDGDNVVQVMFLDRNGNEVATRRIFVKVKHFKTWLSTIKGGRFVFSRLSFFRSGIASTFNV